MNKALLFLSVVVSIVLSVGASLFFNSPELGAERGTAAGIAEYQAKITNAATDARLTNQYAAWQATQAALLQEQQAAAATALAAQQAAEAAQPRTAVVSPAPAPYGSLANPYIYRNDLSGDDTTGQALINSCRGGVDVTDWYSVPASAIEVRCGGSTLPLETGAVIRITGVNEGLYLSSGIVARLNVNTDNTDSLPQGFDYLIQTCHPNASHLIFLGLTKIG